VGALKGPLSGAGGRDDYGRLNVSGASEWRGPRNNRYVPTMALLEDIEAYVGRPQTLPRGIQLMEACVATGGAAGAYGLRRLAEDDYGGMTFKYEVQAPAATCLLLFGAIGLGELAALARADLDSRSATLAMELFASISAGSAIAPMSFLPHGGLADALAAKLAAEPELRDVAHKRLVEIVLAYDNDDDVCFRVGSALTNLTTSETPAAKALFTALAARWTAVSAPTLAQFDDLIRTQPNDEPAFQAFLNEHPHLIDPFAIEVWPEPDLFGFQAPDYVVRRADNTYLVVEIECPGKQLVTQAGQIGADVTHAVAQATGYERYLMSKYADLRTAFPGWEQPDLLVVCGLEASLSAIQVTGLRDYNRRSGVRVVGFDWLGARARAVSANFIRGGVRLQEGLRLV
jgi:hypothetical protein